MSGNGVGGDPPARRHYTARPSWPTPPLTDVDRKRIAIAYERIELETIQARAAAGIQSAIEALPARKAKLAALVREANELEGILSTVERRDSTITGWRAKVHELRTALRTLQADAPKLPAEHVKAETDRLQLEIRFADKAGRDAFRTYLREAATAAATLRAKAEAEGDQQRSIADELTAARLARSATGKGDAQDLMAHARRLIAAGQPAAAKPYMLALESVEHRPANLGQLRAEFGAAMNEADPILSQAAAIERTARDAETSFEIERSKFLGEIGLGTDSTGEAGRGTQEQLAIAGVRAKVIAFAADPEHYSEPAPTGPRIDGSPEPAALAQPAIG
jgi:hypothetical protein